MSKTIQLKEVLDSPNTDEIIRKLKLNYKKIIDPGYGILNQLPQAIGIVAVALFCSMSNRYPNRDKYDFVILMRLMLAIIIEGDEELFGIEVLYKYVGKGDFLEHLLFNDANFNKYKLEAYGKSIRFLQECITLQKKKSFYEEKSIILKNLIRYVKNLGPNPQVQLDFGIYVYQEKRAKKQKQAKDRGFFYHKDFIPCGAFIFLPENISIIKIENEIITNEKNSVPYLATSNNLSTGSQAKLMGSGSLKIPFNNSMNAYQPELTDSFDNVFDIKNSDVTKDHALAKQVREQFYSKVYSQDDSSRGEKIYEATRHLIYINFRYPQDKNSSLIDDCCLIAKYLTNLDLMKVHLRKIEVYLRGELEKNSKNKENAPISYLSRFIDEELKNFGFSPYGKVFSILTTEQFLWALENCILLKDVGAGESEHGEFSHLLQWLLVAYQVQLSLKNQVKFLKNKVTDIVQFLGSKDAILATFGADNMTIWDFTVDILGPQINNADFRQPERMFIYFYGGNGEKEFPILAKFLERRYIKRFEAIQNKNPLQAQQYRDGRQANPKPNYEIRGGIQVQRKREETFASQFDIVSS